MNVPQKNQDVRIKLAILIHHFCRNGGGSQSYAVQLAHAMRGECDITIVAQIFGENTDMFRQRRVPSLPFHSSWINHLWFNWYSRRILRDGFDIIHSHENLIFGNVHTIHTKTMHAGLQEKGFRWLRALLSPRLFTYLWIEKKRLCTRGHHNVFVSQPLLEQTQSALPRLSSGTVIPPGVEMPDRVATPNEKTLARQALGFSPHILTIGFVGHDFKKKGLDVLLRAVALLPFDVQVLIVGNPSMADLYAERANALGDRKKCHFLGLVSDMRLVYDAVDCLAHPTQEDTFAMVVLEALSHGVPVIVSGEKFCGISSFLTNETDALLLSDPHDQNALASLLERVVTDGDLRKTLAENGRRFAEKKSWSEIKKSYYDVYRIAMDTIC